VRGSGGRGSLLRSPLFLTGGKAVCDGKDLGSHTHV